MGSIRVLGFCFTAVVGREGGAGTWERLIHGMAMQSFGLRNLRWKGKRSEERFKIWALGLEV